MSSKDLIFNVGCEHKFPVGLKFKKIKDNDEFYDHWKSGFKKSISECNKKLLKDIQMLKSHSNL